MDNNNNAPNFNQVISEFSGWLNPLLNVVLTFIALLAVFYLIRIGFKLHKATNPEERKVELTNLLWWVLGLIIVFAGYILVNVFLPAISGGHFNPKLEPTNNKGS